MRHHATMSRLLRGMEYSVCWVDNISHADAPWFDVFVARFCYTSCVSHMCFRLEICAGMCLYSFECCWCWKACGLCFSVCVCVLMITKRVSFHFHHGKRQVWDVSMLNVADSAHLRPWMQAWILHVFPSRLPVACFFLRDKCHICRVWWWGGKLSTNQERSLNLWRRIYMHETQGTNAGKPSLSVATFLLVLSSIPTSPPKLVSFQNCRGNISTHFATVLGFNGFNSRWCHDGAFSTLQLFALHCVAQIIHRPTTLEW